MTDTKKPPEKIATPRPDDFADPEITPVEEIAVGDPPPPRKHPVLTDEQYEKALSSARAKIEKERILAAMKQVEEEEIERLRMVEGLVGGSGPQNEMVTVTIDLAEHSDRIVVNMRPYWHGQTYTVPRHIADSLREIMFRGWLHQSEIDGKNKTQFYQRHRNTTISKVGVRNAPQAIG